MTDAKKDADEASVSGTESSSSSSTSLSSSASSGGIVDNHNDDVEKEKTNGISTSQFKSDATLGASSETPGSVVRFSNLLTLLPTKAKTCKDATITPESARKNLAVKLLCRVHLRCLRFMKIPARLLISIEKRTGQRARPPKRSHRPACKQGL